MKRYINKTYLLNTLVAERDKALSQKMPRGHEYVTRAVFRTALRVVAQAPTDEYKPTDGIVHCCECVHWETYPTNCPMIHEEWFDDEDDGLDIITHDKTPKDGSGFCHLAEKRKEDEDD